MRVCNTCTRNEFSLRKVCHCGTFFKKVKWDDYQEVIILEQDPVELVESKSAESEPVEPEPVEQINEKEPGSCATRTKTFAQYIRRIFE